MTRTERRWWSRVERAAKVAFAVAFLAAWALFATWAFVRTVLELFKR